MRERCEQTNAKKAQCGKPSSYAMTFNPETKPITMKMCKYHADVAVRSAGKTRLPYRCVRL